MVSLRPTEHPVQQQQLRLLQPYVWGICVAVLAGSPRILHSGNPPTPAWGLHTSTHPGQHHRTPQ
ncbi:hypothetical protein CGMCC3_g16777 [Colletotrichum fructicola]|nr:uncharacterized protein CGMCC3_g16777 [Colletotrichum fructicola]KAE9567062.1 hypothetical protein CGMCC3_g16777 [Colletotrichum fructicola]